MAYLTQCILFAMPWRFRRLLLEKIFGYSLDPEARIGFSIVAPHELTMGPRSRIGHLNLIRGMKSVDIAAEGVIGNLNWIYGIPKSVVGDDFSVCRLTIEEGAHIVHRHLIDCSGTVVLGRYCLVAGYGSQLLCHSIDIHTGLQGTKRIEIGEFCFVGTRCIILGGSKLPGHSVLGAGSVLRSRFEETMTLYGGVPAEARIKLNPDSGIFTRSAARMDWN